MAISWSPLAEERFRLSKMIDVFVGVGSNIEPGERISAALADLRERFGALELSTAYQNPAIGF
ncbi:MAG: hypothetical protein VX697_00560, partial [Pseudomonadota bacterium]|nr:hypothetical protein [Pseudomonadota bacterium]